MYFLISFAEEFRICWLTGVDTPTRPHENPFMGKATRSALFDPIKPTKPTSIKP